MTQRLCKTSTKLCKNHPVLNFPNEEDDLILETAASNEYWSVVLKIKKGEKLCKYCSGSFDKGECNYPTMKKEILVVIRGIKKFLIFFIPKTFSYSNLLKRNTWFCEKEFIKYASVRATLALTIMA